MKLYFLLIFFIIIFFAPEIAAKDCDYWFDSVGVKDIDYKGGEVDETNREKIMEAIECLLKLEGDKSRGAFGGATSNDVSQLFPQAAVEVCALYYISSLFYEKYDHASGVALWDKKKRDFNSEKSVKTAYQKYRKWFAKVKKIGLEEARKQKLDALKGSNVRWY